MTTLLDVVGRAQPAAPWAEGDNIPWDEPAFSERMLAEHLDQSHDMASRRSEKIDRHVAWIHDEILGGRPARVLDLTCGPGLYTHRLAKLGCQCVGVDFAPAAVRYATETAAAEGLSCTYRQADVRTEELGGGFGLVMILNGQLNVFRRGEAADLLARACASLQPGGRILLEPQTFEHLKGAGQHRSSWYTAGAGLFADRPHLVLTEAFWDETAKVRTERFFVIDAQNGRVTRHALSNEAYTKDQLAAMLARAGLEDIRFYPSLIGEVDKEELHNLAVAASRH